LQSTCLLAIWFVSLTGGIEYYSQQSVLSDPVKKVH
jgi:hypothetical protein